MSERLQAPSRAHPDTHQRGQDKVGPVLKRPGGFSQRSAEQRGEVLPKPAWIRARAALGPNIVRIKSLLRAQGLTTVCEEAQCPNLGECFHQGTATFMILGDRCTRRCPFCDVAHGRPAPPDPQEPDCIAEAVAHLGLRYVVLTSVNRDDLRDGGAAQFAACVRAIRRRTPGVRIECLVPDFRRRETVALQELTGDALPDVFNHNLETVPRLYPVARPGADYLGSLRLLAILQEHHPDIPTKSGLMLGLGETWDELIVVMQDLRAYGCIMLTLGQYLQPSPAHLPVQRYWSPNEFTELRRIAEGMGFVSVASGPLVRPSYQAEQQARGVL
ncbi:lipoyl synthase [Caldichromatium japonicum]|uniref:Lipoyl synthase n=1 Tax=Caldichromatium japonicum TaxID=2699430 RepID=A0A6G7VF60_9GAMM|nr:lipoyl synthase [Caldichromatium japonicum]QIK38679.1 lipoyl synthase [Caldichromatium japonicum]